MLVCKVATSNTNGHWGEYLRVSNRHTFEFMSIFLPNLRYSHPAIVTLCPKKLIFFSGFGIL